MYMLPGAQDSNYLKDDQLKHCTWECKGHREDDLNNHVSNLQQTNMHSWIQEHLHVHVYNINKNSINFRIMNNFVLLGLMYIHVHVRTSSSTCTPIELEQYYTVHVHTYTCNSTYKHMYMYTVCTSKFLKSFLIKNTHPPPKNSACEQRRNTAVLHHNIICIHICNNIQGFTVQWNLQ